MKEIAEHIKKRPYRQVAAGFLLVAASAGLLFSIANATVSGTYHINIGGNPGITSSSKCSAIGHANTAYWESGYDSLYSLVVGKHNSLIAQFRGSQSNLMSGDYNTLQGDFNFVAGRDNDLDESFYSSLIGRGLQLSRDTSWPARVVVGQYNDDTEYSSSLAFAVGNGNGDAQADRSNALIVYQDGTIEIPVQQGDVSMGIYDN